VIDKSLSRGLRSSVRFRTNSRRNPTRERAALRVQGRYEDIGSDRFAVTTVTTTAGRKAEGRLGIAIGTVTEVQRWAHNTKHRGEPEIISDPLHAFTTV